MESKELDDKMPYLCHVASLAVRCILPVLWGLDHDEERRLHTKLTFRATDYLFYHPTVAYSSFRPAFGVPWADFTTGGFLWCFAERDGGSWRWRHTVRLS